MLRKPHQHTWKTQIKLLHGHGLYLSEIEYDARCMMPGAPRPFWQPLVPSEQIETDDVTQATEELKQ